MLLSAITRGAERTKHCFYHVFLLVIEGSRFLSWFHTLTSVLEMLEEENRGNYEEQVLAFSQLVKVGKLNVSLKSSKMKHIPPVKSDSWKIYSSRVFSNFIHHN